MVWCGMACNRTEPKNYVDWWEKRSGAKRCAKSMEFMKPFSTIGIARFEQIIFFVRLVARFWKAGGFICHLKMVERFGKSFENIKVITHNGIRHAKWCIEVDVWNDESTHVAIPVITCEKGTFKNKSKKFMFANQLNETPLLSCSSE